MLPVKKKSNRCAIKKTESRSDSFTGDVTIHDFANAAKIHARIKKAAAFTLEVEANHEADLDEMDKSVRNSRSSSTDSRKNEKAKDEKDPPDTEGVDYPLDIWFLISEYITPEAVGKFARICRSSYHVTTTGKFWFHLYKSYYRFVPDLPERLKPHCMVRMHGLRACVIRTLHYTYFSLRREMDNASHLRQEPPHSLVKRQCCSMWHKQGKQRWYFFFKLREIPKRGNSSLRTGPTSNRGKRKFLETVEEVAINPEERSKVLRVTCLKYSMLPPVIGLVLQKVTMTLMPGFKYHKIQLGFGTSAVPNTVTSNVILNDVIDYKTLDWWHPCYPHEDSFGTIELPEIDLWD